MPLLMILRFFVLTREKPNPDNRSSQYKATTRQALRCRKNRPLSQVLNRNNSAIIEPICCERLCSKGHHSF